MPSHLSVSDGTNTASGSMTINVADVNDETPVLNSASYTATVAETAASGTSLVLSPSLTVSDGDAGDTYSFSLSGTATKTKIEIL